MVDKFIDPFARFRRNAAGRRELISLSGNKQIDLLDKKSLQEIRLGVNPSAANDRRFFYVSDLHLEARLSLIGEEREVAFLRIRCEVSSLIEVEHTSRDVLLIGGDVGHDAEFTGYFYECLNDGWRGLIVGVLGNHELWHGNPAVREDDTDLFLSAQNVIDLYESGSEDWSDSRRYTSPRSGLFASVEAGGVFGSVEAGPFVVENGLILDIYGSWMWLSEEEIADHTDEELSSLLTKSSVFILAGMGWAGQNKRFNADVGIYLGVVERDEEIKRSAVFSNLYQRCLRLSTDTPGVVLTHMPMGDWSEKVVYNPSWFYVHGHTHRNGLYFDNGNHVFFDNQLGYEFKDWGTAKYFNVQSGMSDAFSDLGDGIWEINREDYIRCIRSQGIHTEGCAFPGTFYLVQKSKYRAFFLESPSGKSLSLLRGGARNKAKHSLSYYYENIEKYGDALIEVFSDYRKTLELISRELKLLGFSGAVHGSIVDIDFENHISVSPVDNSVTIYQAPGTHVRRVLPSFRTLIQEEATQRELEQKGLMDSTETSLNKHNRTLDVFDKGVESGLFPLLDNLRSSDEAGIQSTQESKDALYYPSRLMLGIQRSLDHGIIQVWNDDVIDILNSRRAIANGDKRELGF